MGDGHCQANCCGFFMSFDAKYSYSSALKFFAFANAFACGFTFLSLIFVLFFGRHGLTPEKYFLLFLHDLVMMSLVLSGVAAGTTIGYIARYGNTHAGWIQLCDRVSRYCNKVTISMILSYHSFACWFLPSSPPANLDTLKFRIEDEDGEER